MRIFTLIAGVVLTLAGLALLVLPGPGIPLLIAGMALLGRHIPAVKRLEDRLRRAAAKRMTPGRTGPDSKVARDKSILS